MNAEGIRALLKQLENQFGDDCPTVSPEVACLKLQFAFLGEIAAQLAELNAHAKAYLAGKVALAEYMERMQ